MAQQLGHVAKQLQRCIRTLDSFTDGQVCMVDCDWDQMTYVSFQVAPNGGLYNGAAFEFKVDFKKDYPQKAPTVTCITPIYHPNIDPHGGEGNVCVTLLNDWSESNTLEDVVQALLFLMYNPAVDDPLSDLTQDITEEDFEKTVKAIYNEGKNPFTENRTDNNDEDEEDYQDNEAYTKDDFFTPALSQFKDKSREEWAATMAERNIEWDKVMEDEAFAEKLQKWEEAEKVRIEEEKKRQEEEEKKRQEEEEKKRQEEEEQRRKEEEEQRLKEEEEQKQKAEEEQKQTEGEQMHLEEKVKEERDTHTISLEAFMAERGWTGAREQAVPIAHPEAQVYNLFYQICQSIKSKVLSFLTCGRTDNNANEDTQMQNQESNPLIAVETVSTTPSPSNLELNEGSPSQEKCADKRSGLEPRRRTESCTSEVSQCRPEYKRCISC